MEAGGHGLKASFGRALQRQELAQEGDSLGGPGGSLVAAAGAYAQGVAVFEPACAKLVESGLAYPEPLAGIRDAQVSGVKLGEGVAKEILRQTMEELAFFTGRRMAEIAERINAQPSETVQKWKTNPIPTPRANTIKLFHF